MTFFIEVRVWWARFATGVIRVDFREFCETRYSWVRR